jgi:hypothetical protein
MNKLCLAVILLVATLSACNSNKQNQNQNELSLVDEIKTEAQFISDQKLFEGVSLPVYTEKISVSGDKTLKMPTGAEIDIPANAFIDRHGNEIKGDVTIKYKEIKSPADIIIENINMTYDSAGQTYQFMTAGMFDLRAFSGDNELLLKEGKSIEVSYLSDKPGHYNFYHYDKGWKYAGVPKENIPLNAGIKESKTTGMLEPTQVNTEEDLIVDIKLDHKRFSELAIYKKVLWKYAGDLGNEDAIEILRKPVSKTSLEASGKKGGYLYKFSTASGNFEFPVKPVFSEKAMKEAMKAYQASQSKPDPTPQIKRTIDVSRLGLMNYDVIYKYPNPMVVEVEFTIKNNENQKVEGLPLFHITGEDNVLVDISKQKQITYSKKLNNKFVAVLPGKKVAVLGTSGFLKTINEKGKATKILIELTELEEQILSGSDLNRIISGL